MGQTLSLYAIISYRVKEELTKCFIDFIDYLRKRNLQSFIGIKE